MADSTFIYKLDLDTSGIETGTARASLEALKRSIIATEQEIAKLKVQTKGNAQAQLDSAGPLSQHEARLKALRVTYNDTARNAAGLEGFTAKLGKQFAVAVGPINDLVSRLGPLGATVQGISSKLSGLGTSSAQSADGIGKLNAFTSNAGKAAGGALLGITALVGGLAALGVGINSSIQAYDNSIKAQRSLEVALGFTSTALLEQASTLQDLTGMQDDAITKGQAYAATLGLTEDQILKITPAVLDLAAATGQDVNTAFEKVASTLVGGRDALKKYGIEIDKTGSLSDRVGQAVEGLGSKFAGQAEAIGNAGSGGIVKFQNTIDDLQETLGRIIIQGIGPFVEGLTSMVHGLDDAINSSDDLSNVIDSATQGLRDQQVEYTTLILKLQDANTKEDKRKEIISQLNTQYAEYLPQLVSEKTTNEQLTSILKKGNDEFVKRIALRSQEAVLQQAAEESGKLLQESLNKEAALRKAIATEAANMDRAIQAAGNSSNLVARLAGKSLQEQIELLRRARKENDEGGSLFGSAGGVNQVELFALQVKKLGEAQGEATSKLEVAQEQLTEMQSALGITSSSFEETSDATADYAKNLELANSAAAGGTASHEQLKLVLADIDKTFRSGKASANDLGAEVKKLNEIIDALPATPENVGIRDSLIKEREAIQKEIKSLSGDATKSRVSDNEKTAKSYADRLKSIQASLDLEFAAIDNAEEKKLVSSIESDKRRNEALAKALDERIRLEQEAALKASTNGEISTEFKLKISGLEEERAKVQKDVDALAKEIEDRIVAIKARVAIEVDMDLAELDQRIADAVAFDDLRIAFDETFADAGVTLGDNVRTALLDAAKSGNAIDFAELVKNADLPKAKIEELQSLYTQFQLQTERNRLELVKKQDVQELEILRKELEELLKVQAELTEKQGTAAVDFSIEFSEEELEKLNATQEKLDELEGKVVDVEVKVNVDQKSIDTVGDQIEGMVDKVGGGKKKGKPGDSPIAKLLGVDQDQAEQLVEQASIITETIGSIFLDSQSAQIERTLRKQTESLDAQYDYELNSLQDRLDAGEITQAEFDKKALELEKETEEKKLAAQKTAFEKQKKIKKQALAIELGLELAKIGVAAAETGPAYLATYAILAAAALAKYASNVSLINSAEFAKGGVVELEEGGSVAGADSSVSTSTDISSGAVLQGPSHAEGGIKAIVGKQRVVELEGNETVINAKSSKIFRNELSRINSHNGWGVSFASGGIVRAPSFSAPTFAHGGMLPPVFADGGMISLIPSDGTIANRRQLEQAQQRKTSRVIQLNGEQEKRQSVVYLSELSAKTTKQQRSINRISFGE